MQRETHVASVSDTHTDETFNVSNLIERRIYIGI